jgi:tetratricopeptide (TPR) repeat protein
LLLSAGAWAQEEPDLSGVKGEAKARIQNLDQYLEDWDLEAAKAELEALEKLAPADVEPLAYYQGRIAFEEGRYDDALTLLEKAGLTDKPGSWVRLVKDTGAIVRNYAKVESARCSCRGRWRRSRTRAPRSRRTWATRRRARFAWKSSPRQASSRR